MRVPVAVSLKSRDGGVSRDAKMMNAIAEVVGDGKLRMRKRPGCSDLGLVKSGTAQLLYAWAGLKTVQGDYLNKGSITSIVSSPVQTNLSPTNAGLMFSAQETGSDAATELLMIKNAKQAWTVDRAGAASAVTYGDDMGETTYAVASITRVSTVATVATAEDPRIATGDSVVIAGSTPSDYNGTKTVTGVTIGNFARTVSIAITRSGTTATATSAEPHGLSTGTYTISGAAQSEYNGSKSITVTSPTTFTFTVSVTSTSAITGTWNPSDKAAAVTLSGGDLTATSDPSAPNYAGVRGTVSKSAGQWAFEVTLGTIGGNNADYVGIATSSQSLTAFPDLSANAWVYRRDGFIFSAAGGVAVASATSGDVIGVFFDGDANTVAFFKNGVLLGGFSSITGTVYPFYSGWDLFGGTPGSQVTANFAGPFTYNYDMPYSPATGSPQVDVAAQNWLFTFTVAGTETTPATGTITATTVGGTVPGIVYLNGYFFVMDVNGVIWNSAIEDPTDWDALAFIIAQQVNGRGKALARSLNYVVAFKEWSTEFLFDRQDGETGSPLSPVETALSLVGCASGDSVAEGEGVLAWMSQTRQHGRGVHLMQGTTIQKVSTPDVDRVLNADPLTTVHAYWLKLDGHALYLLTLVGSNITLVYDATAQVWKQWSSLTAGTPVSVTSITAEDSYFLVIAASHGLSDGDPVLIAGADQADYNGIHHAFVIDVNSFAIELEATPVSPATGTITATPYTETYFKFTKYAAFAGVNLMLHESNGHLYQIDSALYRDAGLPINVFARTERMDGGTTARKKMPVIRLVGDSSESIALVRYSDDDCQTFEAYRSVDLSDEEPELRKNGGFKRRTLEVRHIANTSLQLDAIEMEITQ